MDPFNQEQPIEATTDGARAILDQEEWQLALQDNDDADYE